MLLYTLISTPYGSCRPPWGQGLGAFVVFLVCVWLLFIFEDSWAHMGSSCGIVLLKIWHFPESDDPFNYSHHSGACAAAVFFEK